MNVLYSSLRRFSSFLPLLNHRIATYFHFKQKLLHPYKLLRFSPYSYSCKQAKEPVCDEDDFIDDGFDSDNDDSSCCKNEDNNNGNDSDGLDHQENTNSLKVDTLYSPFLKQQASRVTLIAKSDVSKKKRKQELNSKIPIVLHKEEIEEKFVRGSGPGGQSVNKSNNCVQLLHLPTGISVSCHETRELTANRKIARRWLKEKLDFLYNGANSKLAIQQEKIRKRKRKAER